jgi:hypothetical protein
MTSFYRVPKYIFDPIGKTGLVKGKVLLPSDYDGELAAQVRKFNVDDVTINRNPDNVLDLDWWSKQKDQFDWVVAITQGDKDKAQWITECGMQSAKNGLCILDRLTFLEPTRNREDFLLNTSLANIKILSPRPSFRADNKATKDSVTSAWFVFHRAGAALISTNIDFEVGWHRPQDLKL